MTVNTYHIWTRPTIQLFYGSRPPALTADGLAKVMTEATVRGFITHGPGQHEVVVDLQCDSHDAALTQIADAAGLRALDVSQAIVQEWATAAAEGAVFGGGTGFIAGGGSTDSLLVAVLSAVVGIGLGAAFGSLRKTLVAEFDARRYQPSAPWSLTRRNPTPVPQPSYAY